MKRERITYPGAYHHIMNRGYDGNAILETAENKSRFLDYLKEASEKLKIRLFAYCIMGNHYHLVLENSSGRLSDFSKLLNGNFGAYYRKMFGGKGYVFESRFKSTIIEDDGYLIKAINYCLQNPVRAGIVLRAEEYIWSSSQYYFQTHAKHTPIVDTDFVNQLFGSKEMLLDELARMGKKELYVNVTKHGEVLGSEDYFKQAREKHNRRQGPSIQDIGVKRNDEGFFEPVEKVFWEFKEIHGVAPDSIDTATWEGKRLRGKLLVYLKDYAGLKYDEIAKIPIFSELNFSSLRSLYQRSKKGNLTKEA